MNEARASILSPDVSPGLASDAMGGESNYYELTPNLVEEDGDNWDFAYATVDPHVNVRASFRLNSDTIRKLCRSASVAVPEDASGVFSLALKNRNAMLQRSAILQYRPKVTCWNAYASLKRLLQCRWLAHLSRTLI